MSLLISLTNQAVYLVTLCIFVLAELYIISRIMIHVYVGLENVDISSDSEKNPDICLFEYLIYSSNVLLQDTVIEHL